MVASLKPQEPAALYSSLMGIRNDSGTGATSTYPGEREEVEEKESGDFAFCAGFYQQSSSTRTVVTPPAVGSHSGRDRIELQLALVAWRLQATLTSPTSNAEAVRSCLDS